MTLRASIVLLAVLNLGVAAWWLLRPDNVPAAVVDPPSGIARLQLLSERVGPAPAKVEAAAKPDQTEAPAAAAAEAPAAPERCYSFGPFADAATLATAQAALRPGALRLRTRETREGGGRGWRVYLPAAADRAAANANADKLKAAGFTDLLVVGDGIEANSVALGRFSSEPRAQQHAQALRAAGFEAARAEPLGEVRIARWIDLAAAEGFDAAAARRASGSTQSRATDCAGVR
ncbi:MAG: SPOR domain-containing protein [Pseudomonadota bacterium]